MADQRLLIGLLAICLAAGCRAQTSTQGTPDLAMQRRIEVLIRSQFGVAPDVNVTLGPRTPSKFNGYDNLPVTFTKDSNSQKADYLISADGQTLVHMVSLSVVDDPVFSISIAGRPIRGNANAKVTVINFDDLECGFCARMHAELFPKSLDHYKVRCASYTGIAPCRRFTPGRCTPLWTPIAWLTRVALSTGPSSTTFTHTGMK